MFSKEVIKRFLICIELFTSTIQATTIPDFKGYQLSLARTPLPIDVSFCIVDLKYNKPHLKICEFGEGIESGFHGHQSLYGRNLLWNSFWDFMGNLNIPIYVVGFEQTRSLRKEFPYSFEKLQSLNVLFKSTFSELEKNYLFVDNLKKHNSLAEKLDDSSGIVLGVEPHKLHRNNAECMSKYSSLLLLDRATRSIVLNKLLTHLMFQDDPVLEQYRPQCLVLPCEYSTEMTQQILSSLSSDVFVIKPINSWKGRGIIFTTRDNLDSTLKNMFTTSSLPKKEPSSKDFEFWRTYGKKYFLIESYEASESITVNKKPYDATMRVAFGLAHDNGSVIIKFFGCYWKLPKKSITEKGSFDDKHKSHIHKKGVCSAKVDKQIEAEVYAILEKIMPNIYQKMIAAHTDSGFITGIRKKINGPRMQPVIRSNVQEVC